MSQEEKKPAIKKKIAKKKCEAPKKEEEASQEPSEMTPEIADSFEETKTGEIGPLCSEVAYVFSHVDGRIRELTNRRDLTDFYWIFELNVMTPQGPLVIKDGEVTGRLRQALADGMILHTEEYLNLIEREFIWWFKNTLDSFEKQHTQGTSAIVNANGDAIDDPTAGKVII